MVPTEVQTSMNGKWEQRNPLEWPELDRLLLTTGNCTVFHSSSWIRALCESYDYRPVCFSITDNGKLTGFVPFMEIHSILTGRRGVSLPFSDSCEPIVSGEGEFREAMDQILYHARERRWKYVELRGGSRFLPGVPASACFYEHNLDLARSEKEIYYGFKDSVKRNIRRAVREGVVVDACYSLDSIKEFYRLNCLTRKRHGLPPQPLSFFESVFRHILSNGQGVVMLASRNGNVMAGAVYFHFGEKAIYKYGASDTRYQHLRANDLIMWEAIRRYSNNGFKVLSFGRSEPQHEGLRRFKAGFGTDESKVWYYRYAPPKERFVAASNSHGDTPFYSRFLSHLPVPLLRIAGMLLYRHFG